MDQQFAFYRRHVQLCSSDRETKAKFKLENHRNLLGHMIPIQSGVLNSSLVFCCIIFYFVQAESIHTEEGLELLFRERSRSDWENVWHQETHSRCRDKLIRHLYWACEKDIYRLTRRNHKRVDNANAVDAHKRSKPISHAWLKLDYVNTLLRFRRTNAAPSITNECCTKIGCTWEEYAEYCPSNKRRNHY